MMPLFILLAVALGVVWATTGLSPFIWASRWSLHAEAARQQAWATVAAAWHHYRENYRATHTVVKQMEGSR